MTYVSNDKARKRWAWLSPVLGLRRLFVKGCGKLGRVQFSSSLTDQNLTQEEIVWSKLFPLGFCVCVLNSMAPNEVSVTMNWDMFWNSRISLATPAPQVTSQKRQPPHLHLSLSQLTHQEILGVLGRRQWWELDQTLSSHRRVWLARLIQ